MTCVSVVQVRQAVPAFITIVTMPLTYSIAYGVIAGEALAGFSFSLIFELSLIFGLSAFGESFGHPNKCACKEKV